MAASSLALVDDRLAFLVSKLPAEEILKIALHGLRNSAATRSFATERHAATYPLCKVPHGAEPRPAGGDESRCPHGARSVKVRTAVDRRGRGAPAR